MTLAQAIDAYVAALEVRALRPKTIRRIRRTLERLPADLDLVALTAADVRACLRPFESCSPRYYNREVSAFRAFLRWAARERLLLIDLSPTIATRAEPDALPEVLTETEVDRLLGTGEARAPWGDHPRAPWALRDVAIVALLYSSGLRREEIIALDVSDVDVAQHVVLVHCGKGGKGRVVPLGHEAAGAVHEYLTRERPQWVAGPEVTALFVSTRGPRTGTRLRPEAIDDRVRLVAQRAGLDRRVSPHMLRHSFATHLLHAGAGVRHVQEMLGHAWVVTTQIYTRLSIGDLAAVHARTHPRGGERRCSQSRK